MTQIFGLSSTDVKSESGGLRTYQRFSGIVSSFVELFTDIQSHCYIRSKRWLHQISERITADLAKRDREPKKNLLTAYNSLICRESEFSVHQNLSFSLARLCDESNESASLEILFLSPWVCVTVSLRLIGRYFPLDIGVEEKRNKTWKYVGESTPDGWL